MKARRQAEILAIIQEYDIETQDQLLEKLREKGMKSTKPPSLGISRSFTW